MKETMARVQVQVVGGSIVEKHARTIGELKSQMDLTNYQGSVNGEPEQDNYELNDYEFVSFSQQVKGA